MTNIPLFITEYSRGGYFIDARNEFIEGDLGELEIHMSKEEAMLQDIEDKGCPQLVKTEVNLQRRTNSTIHLVLEESQSYAEQKLPFAGAGLSSDNGVKDSFHELKLSYFLRSCNSIPNFIRVVLNDARTHPKSYLHDCRALGHLAAILITANEEAVPIPWSLREIWARQFITAVFDIHARGSFVGFFKVQHIGIRSDGIIIVLDPPKTREPAAIVQGWPTNTRTLGWPCRYGSTKNDQLSNGAYTIPFSRAQKSRLWLLLLWEEQLVLICLAILAELTTGTRLHYPSCSSPEISKHFDFDHHSLSDGAVHR